MRRTSALLIAAALVLAACSSDDGGSGSDATADPDAAATTEAPTSTTAAALGEESERYADLALWHCHPDKDDDACDTADLGATSVDADGTQTPVEHVAAVDPPIDCFYVYPTVEYTKPPGVQGFDEPINPLELITIANTFARYSEVCRQFAPRYEQMTITGYGDEGFEEYFAVGDAQVTEAFDHYLATENDGRPFVLIGHSQGTHHLIRMMQDRFEGEGGAALRSRLLHALLLGPTGWLEVPDGEVVGGTFEDVPLCATPDDTGCIVAFDSYAASHPPDPDAPGQIRPAAGMVRACTNPADLTAGEDSALLGGPFLSSSTAGVSTPNEVWPAYYSARCARDASGQPFLEISAAPDEGDIRVDTVLDRFGANSLHVLDPNFAMGDLLDLLAAKSAAIAG